MDWKEVRINAAINAMNSLLSSSIVTFLIEFILRKGVAKVAVKYADELVEELKKEDMEEKDTTTSAVSANGSSAPEKPYFDEYLTLCACSSSEHQMIWRVEKEDNGEVTIYCDVHLVPLRWYERLWQGLKYIFGHRSIYGEFEEYIFRKCDLPKFEKLVKDLKKSTV